jgi:hypothetical protein
MKSTLTAIILYLTLTMALADNLSSCLSGKYPSLCNKGLLSDSQRQQANLAERSENLKTCLTGKYPSLCKRNLLSPQELIRIQEAERLENLKTCLTGKYPSLCKRSLLAGDEITQVDASEKRGNLATCLTGRYPILCKKGMLTLEQKEKVDVAEKNSQLAKPSLRAPSHTKRGSSGCESGHWVEHVMPDGEFIKLEDGSVWEIDISDQIDTMLWLPTTDIIACSDKLVNTDDNETAGARKIR